MVDELRLVGAREGVVIQNCLDRLRFFCENDAYPAYDVVGQHYEQESNQFQNELLYAMNRAMMARSSRKAWQPFLDTSLSILAAIPTETDLVDSSDDEYIQAREALKSYYSCMSAVNWITDMAASKMLFLKRPRLVAISDSCVREALGIESPDTHRYPWKEKYCAERALRVSDTVREVGKVNLGILTWLQEQIRPSVVSKARIIDILVWVDMAINQGHKMWSQTALENGWTSIGHLLKQPTGSMRRGGLETDGLSTNFMFPNLTIAHL